MEGLAQAKNTGTWRLEKRHRMASRSSNQKRSGRISIEEGIDPFRNGHPKDLPSAGARMPGCGFVGMGLSGASRPKVASGKGVAGTGFQIAFKVLGLIRGFEGDVKPNSPRLELGRVTTFSCIVLFQAVLQVGCLADLTFTWLGFAFQDIGIVHRCGQST
jgi:hypothetical protein